MADVVAEQEAAAAAESRGGIAVATVTDESPADAEAATDSAPSESAPDAAEEPIADEPANGEDADAPAEKSEG